MTNLERSAGAAHRLSACFPGVVQKKIVFYSCAGVDIIQIGRFLSRDTLV